MRLGFGLAVAVTEVVIVEVVKLELLSGDTARDKPNVNVDVGVDRLSMRGDKGGRR